MSASSAFLRGGDANGSISKGASSLSPAMIAFGRTPDGRNARLFALENTRGVRAEITDYGGTLVRWFAPDRHGQRADILLGFDDVSGYADHTAYFGALIGRVGNRIADGKFSLGERSFRLALNNHPGGIGCHLHGGVRGFDKIIWQAEPLATAAGPALRLRHRSPDGDEGYPGNLDVTVTYTLTDDNELKLEYVATTDAPTPVNLTNHAYFNLAGHDTPDVLGHVLTLRASRYTPVTPGLIPTGELADVAGTPLDFTTPHTIGERIDRAHEQLRYARGYDHNFVLDHAPGQLALAALAFEPKSGRCLEVLTTEPGVQFYSGNFLDGSWVGKAQQRYGLRSGFCLETQHFPDSPNQPGFPSVILRPGETLRSTTVYRVAAR